MKMNLFLIYLTFFPVLSSAQIFIDTGSEKLEFRPVPTPTPASRIRFTFKSDVEIPFSPSDRTSRDMLQPIKGKPFDVYGVNCTVDLSSGATYSAKSFKVTDYGKRERSVSCPAGTVLYSQNAYMKAVPRRLDCEIYEGDSLQALGKCAAVNTALEAEFKKTLESNAVYSVYLAKIESLDREIADTQGEVQHEESKSSSNPNLSDSRIYLQLLKDRKTKIVSEQKIFVATARKSFFSARSYRSVHKVQYEYNFEFNEVYSEFADTISCLGEIQEVKAMPDASDADLWQALGSNAVTLEKFIASIHSPQVLIENVKPEIYVR